MSHRETTLLVVGVATTGTTVEILVALNWNTDCHRPQQASHGI